MLKMLYKTYTFVERDGMCRYNTVLRDLPIRSRLKKNTRTVMTSSTVHSSFLRNIFSKNLLKFFLEKTPKKVKVRYRKK